MAVRRFARAFLAAVAVSAAPLALAEDVKIGVIAPFTGPAAGFGKQIEAGMLQLDAPAGDRRRHGVGAGLDPVRQDAVDGAMQAGHAVDADLRRAGALDPRPHRVQAAREIDDLRLARGVLEDRLPLGQRGGHHQVLGAGHRHQVHDDARAAQPPGLGQHVAVLDLDAGAHCLQALHVLVHRALPDGAAAR